MSKFSKREKILLSFLLILAIVAVGVMLVIQPLKEEGKRLENDYYAYEKQKINMQAVLDSADGISKTNDEKDAEVEAAKANYPARIKSYEIHNMLAGLCADYAVTIGDLAIKDYAALTGADKKPVGAGPYSIYSCDISLKLLGTSDALLRLEHACCEYKDNMQVSAFVIDDLASDGTQKEARLQLRLYAIEGEPEAAATPAKNERAIDTNR